MVTDSDEYVDLDTACRDYFGVNPIKGADPSRFRDMRAFFSGGTDSVVLIPADHRVHRSPAQGRVDPRAATGARFLFKPEEGIRLLAPVITRGEDLLPRLELQEPPGRAGEADPDASPGVHPVRQQPGRPRRAARAPWRGHVPGRGAGARGRRSGSGGSISPPRRRTDHVAGYTIAFDMGYRDLQYPTPTSIPDWVMGKGFDATMAVGPWIVPKEEVGDPYPLKMELKVAGQVRQARRQFRLPVPIAPGLRAPLEGDHLRAGRRDLAGDPGRLARLRVRQGEPEAEDRRRRGRAPSRSSDASRSRCRHGSVASPRSIRNSAVAPGRVRRSPAAPFARAPANGWSTSSARTTSSRLPRRSGEGRVPQGVERRRAPPARAA